MDQPISHTDHHALFMGTISHVHRRAPKTVLFAQNLVYEKLWPDDLNITTFQTQKYGCSSIRASTIYSWNSLQDLLIKNLSLKNTTGKKIKYFLTKHVIENY